MRERRIMFSDAGWQLVQQEAKVAKVSAAQFVREAAIAYAIWKLAKRGGDDFTAEVESIVERLRSE
jgi:hypothetical protein